MKRARTRYYLIVTIVIATIFIALTVAKPAPQQIMVMATSAPGSYYELLGKRYQERFAKEGIELRLQTTAGAMENLKLLNDPHSGVSAGFVQSGTTNEKLSPRLVSLGTVFYEPLWLFYEGTDPRPHLEGLRGKKLSIGPEGSGTRVLALELLGLNGIRLNMAEMLPFSVAESGNLLLQHQINAAIMIASWDTPIVHKLLKDPHIELVNFTRADAYVALYPFLTKVMLPAGVGNMASNRPPVDTYLIATKASLVVQRDLNESIQFLLLDAASDIHSGPGVFQKSGQFPAAEQIDLPISKEARQFYKSGLPFLQRTLPFRFAAIAEKLLIILIPIIGILYPLFRLTPVLFGWIMRRRIFKLYKRVKSIEDEFETIPTNRSELIARLDDLDSYAASMHVPVMFAQFNYALRLHISLVRQRIQQGGK